MKHDHDKFATVRLWAAVADIPSMYGLAAAKGALTSLRQAIERTEKGLPPLFEGDLVDRRQEFEFGMLDRAQAHRCRERFGEEHDCPFEVAA